MVMKTVRILGTGSFVPPKVLSNFDLQNMDIDTSDEWIVKRTGIHERRMADPDVATSDLAYEASLKALEMAARSVDDIDLIIMATVTPDTCSPSGSNWLQARLKATRAFTFDITAACSGFIFALNVAEQYLKNGTCRTVLVVAAEVMTRTLDWKDRSSCVLWGDGAGAAVLTMADSGPQILSTHIHSDGANGQLILLPGGGSRTTPITRESVERGDHYLKLVNGNLSFRMAVRRFEESIRESVCHNGFDVDAVDWFIPHQANLRMFQILSRSLKVPLERFYLTIGKYGNISSASCAIALDEAVRDGSIKPDNLVCLPVFGGGLTWGSALIRW